MLRDIGGIWVTLSRDIRGVPRCAHLTTLRHFDNKVHGTVKMALLIPCERRLENIEISEFQEVTFEARFGNRDYGRPYLTILVTLRGFD